MTNPLGDAPAPQGMKPWIRVVLGLSLAVNLLIIGLVLGAVLRFGGPGANRPPPTGVSLIRALPSDDRRALRDHLHEILPPPADRLGEARDLAAPLMATPFDPAALEAVVQEQAATRSAFQDALQQAWLDHVMTMDDADKAAYAKRLLELAEHGRPPKGPPDSDD
ncbi:MAG: hypothetical protein CML68_19815 [Rhodobacteraceae bacterium]|nr:hypothetical protein [Paracoccaceae bacterium]